MHAGEPRRGCSGCDPVRLAGQPVPERLCCSGALSPAPLPRSLSSLRMLRVSVLMGMCAASRADGWYKPIPGAPQYMPYFDDVMIAMEAENFTVAAGSEFVSGDWGHAPHRYAATIANTFMSRRSCLHAPANVSSSSSASMTFSVTKPGAYNVLLRFEAAYLFETPFQVEIMSGATPVFTRTYGLRQSLKVQGFGKARLAKAAGAGPTGPYTQGSMCGSGRAPTDGMQAECWWPYGATENWVWEGVGALATLNAGSYTMVISGVNTTTDTTTPPEAIAFAERNIDAVLLTTNTTDVQKRIWYAPDFLALDGYMSQQSEVFMQVKNLNTTGNFTLTVPRVYGHSGYFGNHLHQPVPTADGGLATGCNFQGGGTRCGKIFVPPGGTSAWVDVGEFMDSYNHGSWNFVTPGEYSIQFGIGSASAPTPIGPAFVSTGKGIQAVFDWSTRSSKRIRSQGADLIELAAQLAKQEAAPDWIPGKVKPAPWEGLQVYGTFWTPTPNGGGFADTTCPTCGAAYTAAYAATQSLAVNVNSRDGAVAGSSANKKAYIDIRGSLGSPADIAKAIDAVKAAGPVENIYVASLGDEITVAGGDTSAAAWTAWCATRKATAAQGCGGGANVSTLGISGAKGDPLSNGVYYWSEKFIHAAAIGHFKTMTDQLQAGLPNCNVGANFAPTAYFTDARDGQQYCNNYLGTTYQWIEMFRQGGMTLPWSEDWAWQTPLGSQQMVTLLIDVMRSSVTKHTSFDTDAPYQDRAVRVNDTDHDAYKPLGMPAVPAATGTSPLMMYVMPHFVGNAPASWRRQFYGDIAHGVKIFDLFEFVSSISGYTCDYTDQDGGTYEEIRIALNELGMYEDIVLAGSAQLNLAKTAILYSESADIWLSPVGTPGAAKRSLYLALRHAQIPIDVVNEEDCTRGSLNHYAVLFIVDPQVSEEAVTAIGAWVNTGGHVYVTAGGAQLNEANQTNVAMNKLTGITQVSGKSSPNTVSLRLD